MASGYYTGQCKMREKMMEQKIGKGDGTPHGTGLPEEENQTNGHLSTYDIVQELFQYINVNKDLS